MVWCRYAQGEGLAWRGGWCHGGGAGVMCSYLFQQQDGGWKLLVHCTGADLRAAAIAELIMPSGCSHSLVHRSECVPSALVA